MKRLAEAKKQMLSTAALNELKHERCWLCNS